MNIHTVIAQQPSELWIKTTKLLLEKGNKNLNHEILNLVMILDDCDRDNFKWDEEFDLKFRKIFGDERIDYASAITFIPPKCYDYDWPDIPPPYDYSTIIEGKWNKTYWGRMWKWNDSFNQVEQAIKRINEGKNSKTICINVYDPISDGKKTQSGIPCLLSLDIKPREDGIHLTAFFRSMRVSKSGYADFSALEGLGFFLRMRTQYKMKRITIMGASVHMGTQNEEMKNTKKLLASL